MAYHPDHAPTETEYDLWPVGPYTYKDGNTRYLSEDWFFCQRWLDLGGQVWGDSRVPLKHIGQIAFPLKSQIPELLVKPVEVPDAIASRMNPTSAIVGMARLRGDSAAVMAAL
jgi:hypothetical protein